MPTIDFNGVWRLNPAKSDIPPVTKSQILTIETNGFDVTMCEELINDKGETLIINLSGKFDGSDNPVEGTPFADTVSYRLLDPHTIEGKAKKRGRVCVQETATLASDGNSVSVVYVSYDQKGNTTINFGYFERVKEARQFRN